MLTAEQTVDVLTGRDTLDDWVIVHRMTIERRRWEIVENGESLFGAEHQARVEWLEQQMEDWKALRAALQDYKRELTGVSWRKVLEALDRVGKQDEPNLAELDKK